MGNACCCQIKITNMQPEANQNDNKPQNSIDETEITRIERPTSLNERSVDVETHHHEHQTTSTAKQQYDVVVYEEVIHEDDFATIDDEEIHEPEELHYEEFQSYSFSECVPGFEGYAERHTPVEVQTETEQNQTHYDVVPEEELFYEEFVGYSFHECVPGFEGYAERHTPVEAQTETEQNQTHYDMVPEETLQYEELEYQSFQEYVPGYQAYEERYSESEESYSSEESQPSVRHVEPEIVVHFEFYNPDLPYEPLTIVKEEVQEIIIDVQPTEFEDEEEYEESEEYEVERRDSLEFYDPYAGSGSEHLLYAVIYEHNSRNDDELTVHFLDEVRVIHEKPGEVMWTCLSKTGGVKGHVPVECLTPTFLHENFYRHCGRQEAEELMHSTPVGTYLIRPSDKSMFALSLKAEHGIKHYGIKHAKGLNGGFHIDGDYKKFNTLQDLVVNFRNNREEMATELLYPIGEIPEEPRGVDEEEHQHHQHEVHTFRHSVTQEVIVRANYEAQQEGEISVRQGEPLVINGGNNSHYKVKSLWTSSEGLVPATFLTRTTDQQHWYAGDRSRIMIENELMSEGNGDGSFAVRLCNGDSYVLMVRQGGAIHSYKITENEHGEFVFHAENRNFPALSLLIDFHYERNYSQDESEVSELKLQKPYHKAQELDLGIYEIAMSREIRPDFLPNLTHFHKSRHYDIYSGVLTGRKNMDVVVKQCFEDDPISESSIREELNILNHISHQNIVYLRAWTILTPPYRLVYDSMNRNLIKHLQTNAGSWQDVVDMAGQIANGLVYLEEEGIIHGNLQAKHIFVMDRPPFCPLVKIGGFRKAKRLAYGESEIYGDVMTPVQTEYAAPEVIRERRFSAKSDIWSYGVVIYEILTKGDRLYPKIKTGDELYRWLEAGNRLERPATSDDITYNTIRQCWEFDAMNRPSSLDVFTTFDNHFTFKQTV
ncbi:hypothetical protein WR25_12687 [Diploscapter pachys]|uniref:Tyrosine-protein kinase n=1 Tax=Diploscapter pachys TaxID=2018661 RepID=A0A2A2J4C8_9BILA|nr:hypothetical protein WR25_12687 [Diploscapter pachys]